MATSHVGGLSGAFIPVSEDAGMIHAAETGAKTGDEPVIALPDMTSAYPGFCIHPIFLDAALRSLAGQIEDDAEYQAAATAFDIVLDNARRAEEGETLE